jgi:competence protein ComEA
MKQFIDRVRFYIDKIKYRRGKHFFITVVILLGLMVIAFTLVYINMHIEIKRKENILKSYYQDISNGSTGLDEISGQVDGEEAASGSNDGHSSMNNTGDDSVSILDETGESSDGDDIKAYICGEVKNPGVYQIEQGARIVDLLELAGGQGENACIEVVNLAQFVVDGQRVYVPSRDEVDDGNFLFFTDSNLIDYDSTANKMVNVNTADVGELETLPGIGPVIAQNIVKYRNTNGPFKMKEELKNVTGIGEKKYEGIREFISI